jgi:hypothetical protein
LASVEFPEVCDPAEEEATGALMAEATAQEADTAAMAAVAEETAAVAGALVDMVVLVAAAAALVDMVEVAALTSEEATVRSSSSLLVKRLSARPRLQSWDEAG